MERFGRYLLLERIAQGGMAEVFRAASLGSAGFAKQVALKMLLPEFEEDPTFTSMLVEEAQIAADLQHPNIIKVTNLGAQEGRHFIVMDFLEGQPVSNVILAAARRQEHLPQQFCVFVARQALEGLRYAHLRTDPMGYPMRIVHRDVSPQNIMVTYEGTVCLLDFGIAKAAASAARTRAGVLRGKTGYISPEVVRGQPVNQAMDLYSLGVVMYEMLALRRMRTARNDGAAVEEAASGVFKRFDQMGADVPAPLAEAVYRALAPDVDDRFADASAFGAALDDVMERQQWTWGPRQTHELMTHLFAEEIRLEKETQARLHPIIKEAARQQAIAEGLPPPPNTGIPTPVAQSTARISRIPTPSTTSPPTPPPQPVAPPQPQRPPASPIMLVGALLGAAVVGAGIALLSTRGDDPTPLHAPAALTRTTLDAGTMAGSGATGPVAASSSRSTTPAPAVAGTPVDFTATAPAEVTVDGVEQGTTPLLGIVLEPGRHTVRYTSVKTRKELKFRIKVPRKGNLRVRRRIR